MGTFREKLAYGNISYLPCLNSSKGCSYSDIYVQDHNFKNFVRKKCSQISGTNEREPIFQVWSEGKKGEPFFKS